MTMNGSTSTENKKKNLSTNVSEAHLCKGQGFGGTQGVLYHDHFKLDEGDSVCP